MDDLTTFAYCQNSECNNLTDTKELHKIDITVSTTNIDDAFTKYYCAKCHSKFMRAMGRTSKDTVSEIVTHYNEETQKAKDGPRKKVIPYYEEHSLISTKGSLNYSCKRILQKINILEQQNIEPRSGVLWKDIGYSRGMLHTYLQFLSDKEYIEKIDSPNGLSKYSYKLLEKGKTYLATLESTKTTTTGIAELKEDPYKSQTPDRSYGAKGDLI